MKTTVCSGSQIFSLAFLQLMEPVRTLRRICSILHVLDKDGNTIVMRPQHMLQYLINTNVLGAKRELAKIFSKLKSFVALGTGNHKKRAVVAGMASEICQKVLDWSMDYQNEPTLYVFAQPKECFDFSTLFQFYISQD